MEERALYAAVLAAPHDNTPRLVYADWLDENADRFPQPRAERARAEFIRLQCEQARLAPAGWRQGLWPSAPSAREKRLLFTQGPKWRRAFPAWIAASPFDRGFLRPCRALPPRAFLDRGVHAVDHQVFSLCPLWDIHLFASDWHQDPYADRGQYSGELAEVGRSPMLERVGWLKVSFFRTPTADFLRTGNFANVESLVLNCGPFPEVLEAVAENESFRSLRYVWFGADRWAWAGTDARLTRFMQIAPKLHEANARNLPHVEMRTALRAILSDVVAALTPPLPAPATLSPPPPPPAPSLPLGRDADLALAERVAPFVAVLGCLFALWGAVGLIAGRCNESPAPSPEIRIPTHEVPTTKHPDRNMLTPGEVELLFPGPRRWDNPPPDLIKRLQSRTLPVAPPPRPVPEKEPPPDE